MQKQELRIILRKYHANDFELEFGDNGQGNPMT
jgi:hypothetical protein